MIDDGGGGWFELGCCCLHSSCPGATNSQIMTNIPDPPDPGDQHWNGQDPGPPLPPQFRLYVTTVPCGYGPVEGEATPFAYTGGAEHSEIWAKLILIIYINIIPLKLKNTLSKNSDDTTRWISLSQHFVKSLQTSRLISCRINKCAVTLLPELNPVNSCIGFLTSWLLTLWWTETGWCGSSPLWSQTSPWRVSLQRAWWIATVLYHLITIEWWIRWAVTTSCKGRLYSKGIRILAFSTYLLTKEFSMKMYLYVSIKARVNLEHYLWCDLAFFWHRCWIFWYIERYSELFISCMLLKVHFKEDLIRQKFAILYLLKPSSKKDWYTFFEFFFYNYVFSPIYPLRLEDTYGDKIRPPLHISLNNSVIIMARDAKSMFTLEKWPLVLELKLKVSKIQQIWPF